MSGQPGTAFRSDHLGVNANYNVMFEQCSPLLPHSADIVYGPHPTSGLSYGVKTLDSADIGNLSNGKKNYGDLAEMQGGTLHAPGSVQWWRVTDPGTYLIGFHDDLDPAEADSSFEIGYRAQVYGSASLSTARASAKPALRKARRRR